MHKTKVRTLGHPLETSPSALLVRPISLAGCPVPGGTAHVADTAGAVERGGQEPRYHRAGGMRWGNLPENRDGTAMAQNWAAQHQAQRQSSIYVFVPHILSQVSWAL